MCAFKCEDFEYVLPQPSQVQRCGAVRFARPLRFGAPAGLVEGLVVVVVVARTEPAVVLLAKPAAERAIVDAPDAVNAEAIAAA